jgi:hypothetical protein
MSQRRGFKQLNLHGRHSTFKLFTMRRIGEREKGESAHKLTLDC